MLFDIGGTLLVEESYSLRGRRVEQFLAGIGFPPALGDVSLSETVARMEAAIDVVHQTNRAEFNFRDWLAEGLGSREESELAKLEVDAFRQIGRFSPMPGAREMLTALDCDGIALAAVSNAVFRSEPLADALRFHDVRHGLRFVLSSADLGIRKPNPEIFDVALERIGARAAETWFVGDSFANDVEGALGVGMTAVWFRRDARETSNDEPLPAGAICVTSWGELVERVRAARP